MQYVDATNGLWIICAQDGCTPLHLAASHGNYEVVKMLVSSVQNPDVNARAKVGVYVQYE